MEKHKARYFESFAQRAKINLKNLESSIREMEDSIQRCYVETVHLKSDDFVKLIRLDASFILELFLRYYEEKWEVDDPMFVEAWLLDVVWHELLLYSILYAFTSASILAYSTWCINVNI